VYPDLRLIEFVEHFALAYKIEPYRELSERVLSTVQLHDVRLKRCKELSRGMKQRLVLAKTLLQAPSFLVLDEPASGLDVASRMRLREVVLEQAKAGCIVLISSHILSDLEQICDRAIFLKDGRVEKFEDLKADRSQSEYAQVSMATSIDVAAILADLPVVVTSLSVGLYRLISQDPKLNWNEVLQRLASNSVRVESWRLGQDRIESTYTKIFEVKKS
jgi:ABC-2 type transport system ATP-binding protein